MVLAASFLNDCATEWHTDQPVTPITYRVPAYRAERSVGNLRRLAILPVRVRHVDVFSLITQSERTDAGFTYQAVDYLSEQKGYQVALSLPYSLVSPTALGRSSFAQIRHRTFQPPLSFQTPG